VATFVASYASSVSVPLAFVISAQTMPSVWPLAEMDGVAPGYAEVAVEIDVGANEIAPLTSEKAFKLSVLAQKYKFPFQ